MREPNIFDKILVFYTIAHVILLLLFCLFAPQNAVQKIEIFLKNILYW